MYSKQAIKTANQFTLMAVCRLLYFPAVVKIKFHSKALVLNYISSLFLNCMRINCHKTETCSKQQTDMNLLVVDSLYRLLLYVTLVENAQRNTSAAVTRLVHRYLLCYWSWTCPTKYFCNINPPSLFLCFIYTSCV